MLFNEKEKFLKDLMSSWQMAKIYEIAHPKFIESLEPVLVSLNVILVQEPELVIGIFGNELASGNDIFFDLSKRSIASINHLKTIGIERITFCRSVDKNELINFISLLILPKDKIVEDPQSYLVHNGTRNIRLGKIEGASKVSHGQVFESIRYRKHYENCLDKLPNSFDSLINEGKLDYINLKFVANNIMENLTGNYQAFFNLVQTKGHDIVTFVHLLNVSTLSMYFCHKLEFKKDDCLDIGIAALFHDIGKLYIAKKIIQKSSQLDKEEFTKIKSHTVMGAEILLKHIDGLNILPVVVAFEHHLGYNLSGYPKTDFAKRPHIASLIVSICDVYDALSQRRSYKRDYPPEAIYEIMKKDKGGKFDPKLLDKFFKIMGVWPKGTIVLLEDKRVAIVREVSEEDIFSPRIEVVSEKQKGLIDLRKEKIKIKRSLNPLAEGKKYINLL